MPFTLAHPAAILPLHRWCGSRLPLSALVIGSMTPDFVYFTPHDPNLATHSIGGLFSFCWPVGLVAWLFFTHILERPTIALLPSKWRAGLHPSAELVGISLLSRVSIAVLIGAATHIVWDAFTHATSPLVAAIPQLRATVLQIPQSPIRLYKALQHVSTIVGLAVLATWTISRHRSAPIPAMSESSPAVSDRTRVYVVSLLFVAAGTAAVVNYALHSQVRLERRLFHLAIGGMAGWAVAWTTIALLLMWQWQAQRRTP